VERPPLEPLQFPLTISTAVNRRPSRVPQETGEPLLAQHRDKRSQQRYQQTRIHETRRGDNLVGRAFVDGRNGGVFAWDSGLVQGEGNCSEESGRLFVRIGFEF